MAVLTKAIRKKWLRSLGYEYSKEGIRKFQAKYFKHPADIDGIYGPDTDKLLRHVHHVKAYTTFKPSEFRCPCGRCTGYPTWMRVNELKNLQKIRNHYGRPMEITSGLRCEYGNRIAGGVPDSAHLHGKATDFYMRGVTDSLDHRKKAIDYIKKLPNHDYTYGDGIDSTGAHISKPNMGNALHTQVK